MVTKKTYKTTGAIFQQASRLYQPGVLDNLQRIELGEIVVVQGQYDHVDVLLDTINVPYASISPAEIGSHNGGRVMYVNCASYGALEKKTKEGVASFVADGGRLVSTDWSIGLVMEVFPGKLKRTAKTSDDVVEIQCPTDLARRFIGMNYAQCKPQWWLEGSSDIYDIVGEGVTPIITSEEMEEKYGKPYVAVGFPQGKGEVLHFISHLELQRTRQKTKEHQGSLDDFLKKMKVEKTPEMDDATVAELEAAYSTLNTVAHLCLPVPVLDTSGKSVYFGSAKAAGGAKSMKLA
ncbi:hypothetical protein HYS49_00870 [Candidatus Woesearchaeota archaeon]|nr:hypothetical protein [Candidatus Woesearchaeota archaeon]